MTSGVKGTAGKQCTKCGRKDVECRGLCGACYQYARTHNLIPVATHVQPTRRTSPRHANDGRSKHPLYMTWTQMISRCYLPTANSYHNYGGRGIRVCARWRKDFWNFVSDMGDRPDGKSLDRIDVDGNYTPKNCKWSTAAEQRRNQRRNRNAFAY